MSPPPTTRVTPADLAAATLVCLPAMTPARLRALLSHFGGPVTALDRVRAHRAAEALGGLMGGDPARITALTREWQRRADPDGLARRLAKRGTIVWRAATPDFPIAEPVPDRPEVLLAEGEDPGALRAPRVAVVGTRAATPHGLADARELGAFLAGAGVTVLSGMAIGIDGAAHQGALGAGGRAVGVVATGLDIEYPRRHTSLYSQVRDHGLVLGETGFGVRPSASRFPVRNRIIAALADLVVVVEATQRGGARITAQFALDYGRAVMAVPGSRRNAAAAGTNELIADGAHPLLEWGDVLIALGLSSDARRHTETRPVPGVEGTALLRALGGEPATPDQLASRTAFDPSRVAVGVHELERAGWVEVTRGFVWPR